MNQSPAADLAIPSTPKQPVSDTYHGVKVTEDYRWLENGDDPAVKRWTAWENARTRAWLDELPDREKIEQRLTALFAKMSPSYGGLSSRPGRLFALKFDPDKQQRLPVALDSPRDLSSERVIVDPNELEPKGAVSIDWYVPSADGKRVAVCLSRHGSEEGALHLFDLETGRELPDRIEGVQFPTGGGSAAWTKDGKTIYYTRYPRKGERPEADLNFYQQIYVHRVGTPETEDQYSIG
ncbi:MAG: S9 family peptidase, partial [Chthoniobacteraceae bacterium]